MKNLEKEVLHQHQLHQAEAIFHHYTTLRGVGQMNQALKGTTSAPEQFVLKRRIGSTTYNIGIHFNSNAKEALDEKVRRLLINDLQNTPENVILKPLQADWLSERGSA